MVWDVQDEYYSKLSTLCAAKQVCMDLFVSAHSYTDLASMCMLSSSTGGQLYYYPAFNVQRYPTLLSVSTSLIAAVWVDRASVCGRREGPGCLTRGSLCSCCVCMLSVYGVCMLGVCMVCIACVYVGAGTARSCIMIF